MEPFLPDELQVLVLDADQPWQQQRLAHKHLLGQPEEDVKSRSQGVDLFRRGQKVHPADLRIMPERHYSS